MSESTGKITEIVSSIFEIRNVNQNLNALQFEISRDDFFKPKFVRLVQILEPKNLVARLEEFDGKLFVLVGSFTQPKTKHTWIPQVLCGYHYSGIDGYFRTIYANTIIL